LLLLFSAGCRAGDPAIYPPPGDGPAADLVVYDNHWHTALIFRSADLPEAFRRGIGPAGAMRYVMIGWGDEGFYRANQVTFDMIPRAMFYSRGSVLMVNGYDTPPEQTFDPSQDVYRVRVAEAGLRRAIDAVHAEFRQDFRQEFRAADASTEEAPTDAPPDAPADSPTADSAVARAGAFIDAGPGANGGRFFHGTRHYAIYRTCNHWVAEVLADAGLPVTPAYAMTASNVAFQLRLLDGVHKNGRPLTPWRPPNPTTLRLARGGRP